MLTPAPRAPHPHARRLPRPVPACEGVLAVDRRHLALVAAHRAARPAPRPHWMWWLEQRPQPGRKVY